MYTAYANASTNTPSYSLVCTWYKKSTPRVLLLSLSFDVFVPITAHPLLFLNKWFVQIYSNVYSKFKSISKYYFDPKLLKLTLEYIHMVSTLDSPIMVGHNFFLESTLIPIMRIMWAT